MILIMIPLTIFAGVVFLDDRKYYLISMLIIVYTMLPFVMVFEKRKPQARELIVIAVMAAIGVAGRAAFFWLPQFKPLLAIIIITGISFGAESAFLTGAVAGFTSNFLFGQGPWTPWQMFALGITGFLAGLLFREGRLPRSRWPVCLFGGLSAVMIYGLLMNFASLVMWGYGFQKNQIIAIYASGLPFDLIHGLATVVFLFLLLGPMLEKLERIKLKYGLIETH